MPDRGGTVEVVAGGSDMTGGVRNRSRDRRREMASAWLDLRVSDRA
jgi:hypothetical protein